MQQTPFSQPSFFRIAILLWVALCFSSIPIQAQGPGASVGVGSGTVLPRPVPVGQFYARNYSGKCLDFGPPPQTTGGPVYLYGCNGTIAQQIRVVEINDRHEVRLYLGTKVLGVKQDIVAKPGLLAASTVGTRAAADIPLELQSEADLNTIFARSQIFALDGDSIIYAADRNLVVKVQNARGANRTPLVLGQRNLSDEELWDFLATDGSNARPTNGFVQVSQASDFVQQLQHATWGTVIEVVGDFSLADLPPLMIPAGVTIRGDRRGILMGPEISAPNQHDQDCPAGICQGLFQVAGDDVRITGLRLRGPSRSTDANAPKADGILASDSLHARTFIDHNDLSDWTVAAINVTGEDNPAACNLTDDPKLRPQQVHVIRNFIHHNQNDPGDGYGVVASNNSFPEILGNTFVSNRHSVAGDGSSRDGYRARFNLVLSSAPCYGFLCGTHEQDFDMHGNIPSNNGHHDGGGAGEYLEVGWNTFLGTNRHNFELRGVPCYAADFHNNILMESYGDAISLKSVDASHLSGINTNQFGSANPTNKLGVGDFDGDGKDDLFLATGAAWYYAPAGNAEWRLLSAQTDKMDNLLFGDFDGDGRTDVFTQHGYNWDVSWGGRSRWETINVSWNILGNAAIGDFDGDHRADVFYADGQHWYVSYGGVGQFTLVDDSSFRVADLRFGDFNGDGKTDVFSVVSTYWMVSYSGTSGWSELQPKLTDSVAGLIVADFNGDGRADVTTISLGSLSTLVWKVSYGGMGNWTNLRSDPLSVRIAAIGRFDGNRSADLLLWHGDYLDIAASGTGAAQRQSRQDMR